MPKVRKGYATIQVTADQRDFIKYKIAKALIKGKKLVVSDIIEEALNNTYPKELKSFRKFKEATESEE